MLDFQKLDPFWNLWSKPNPGISSKKLYLAQLNCNLERKIGHEIFVKTEKTEYLSNQLTFAYSDWNFIFPIKFGTSEQIFIFWISKMFHILGKLLLKLGWLGYPEIGQKIFCHICCLRLLRQTAKALKSFAEAIAVAFGMYSCNYSKCYEILMQLSIYY